MLHAEPPLRASLVDVRRERLNSGAAAEPVSREPHIAYGRRQTDTAGYSPDQPREPYKLTDYLIAAVGAGERVYLVDDYESKVAEQTYDVVRAIHQETFERLGRNLQYAARLAKQLRLVRLRDVAVPVEHRYSR